MCVDVHMSVTNSERFFQELRRKFYTTPKSYLDLINLYTALLAEKRFELGRARPALNGLQKLDETNVIIDNLKIELGELQPVLRRNLRQPPTSSSRSTRTRPTPRRSRRR